jgi:4-oxalocrotonate tautomerase
MPLARISMKKGTSAEYRKAIMDGLYAAMRETFNVPEDDRFMVIHQHEDGEFDFGADYLGIQRTDRLVLIQLTVNNTRTVEQKKALYSAIAARLT